MVVVTVEEAQNRLTELLADVAGGEEVVIYRDDLPVGRLLGIATETSPKPRRQFGHFAGRIEIADDFDAPLDDFAEYM